MTPPSFALGPARVRLPAGTTLGTRERRIAMGPLVVVDATHPAGSELPRHEHDGAYLCVVLAGAYQQWASDDLSLARGSLVQHPAGHAHANRFGPDGARCVSMHLDAFADDDSLQHVTRDYRHLAIGDNGAIARLERELAAGDSAAALGICGAAYELLAWLARQPTREPDERGARWLVRVIDAIEADLAAPHALADLAAVAGIHPSHLARSFARARGETVGAYVRRRRLEQADRALVEGDDSLVEVAAVSGFCDQAHFTRAYRRQFGLTPGQRRRNSRTNR